MALKSGSHIKSVHEHFLARCKELGKVSDISQKFSKLNTDEDRVAFVLELALDNDRINLPDTRRIGKNEKLSTSHRNDGNALFQKKLYEEAVEKYTRSVAYAPVLNPRDTKPDRGSTPLSLAAANRSAALFHKGQYLPCLKDIALALESGYPKELRYKIYDRKAKCLLKIGDHSSAKESLQIAISVMTDAKGDNKKLEQFKHDLQKQLNHLKEGNAVAADAESQDIDVEVILPNPADGKHDVFINLSSACDVTYTENQGRFITAKRDILPGEVILVEKPYASVLLDNLIYSHCDYCYKAVSALIPCQTCASAMFCSKTCRQAALDDYHQLECKILPMIHSSGVGKFGHLALRTITKSPLKFWAEFREKVKNGVYNQASKCREGCSESGEYEGDCYNAIYKLVTHDTDRAVHDLFKRAITAVFLCKCLEEAGFFSNLDEQSWSLRESKAFIGGLILSHLQLMPCNAHEINELVLNREDVVNSPLSELGAGIYSTLSLFNHSCDPTANRNFMGDACVVRAIKKIFKGEEVSDNYGAVYAVQTLQERHEKLTPQYYFTCQCEACLKNWPLFPQIKSDKPIYKCQECYTELSNSGICSVCKKQNNLENLTSNFQKAQKLYKEGFDLLLACNVHEAEPMLCNHIKVMQEMVKLPYLEYNTCQEAVKQCFSIKSNMRSEK